MPITSIRLQNFKCFADSGEVPIAPLTVVFGRNNTGKSSILHSLLLLRQTLDSPYADPRLHLDGPLYSAGTYADIVHQHRASQHMRFELALVQERGRSGRIELEFSSDEPRAPRLVSLRVTSPGVLRLEVRRGRGAGGPFELYIDGKSLGGPAKASFAFVASRFLPVIGKELPRRGRPNAQHERSRSAAGSLLSELDESLRNLRTIGAFRQRPERSYEFRGRAPEVPDQYGANVVSALIEDVTRGSARRRGALLRSVNKWLTQVGRVRLLKVRPLASRGRLYELRLKDTDSGRWANYADVGFGIGQALPVIVEGLRTPPGGLFLAQEPEIHLHPDAQLAMADFLVQLVRTRRRVVVESHSENLLLRLRHAITRRSSNGKGGDWLSPDEVSIIYVDKRNDGRSYIEPLKIDEFGQIQQWPAGFMEEATNERMAILEQMAQRSESK